MKLAINWIKATEMQLLGNSLSSENEDAIINLFELCSHHPDDAVEVILQIIEQKPNERVLNHLGAGPIESLFFKYPNYLEKLIAMTSNASALKKCLLYVNYDDGDELDTEMLKKFLDTTP